MGGHINIGIDGPWDVHRILGTVPVEADGSASFKVPANTPIAVQPLDAEGQALQLMRSWFTAMPGESALLRRLPRIAELQPAAADRRWPCAASRRTITPWYGPARGFSFKREVQPVLDKYCVGCHDGQRQPRRQAAAGLHGQERARLAQLHALLHRPAPLRPPARARRATTTCSSRWSTTPAPANWSRCSRKGTTT